MIVASAGRRIDAPPTAEPAFPHTNVDAVRTRLQQWFASRSATLLVCSAACGADLLALDAAGALRMRRRIILPFAPRLFRETSVTDRPGDWGPLFDRILAQVEDQGDLVNLGLDQDTDQNPAAAYQRANDAILSESIRLGRSLDQPVLALLIWNGVPREEDDMTSRFGQSAASLGLPVAHVSTL